MISRALRLSIIAVLAGAIAGASLVVVTSSTVPAIECDPHTSGPTPLGASMAFGSIEESSAGANHWYNTTVQSVGGDYRLLNLRFQIHDPTGSLVIPTSGWNLSAWSFSGALLGYYSMWGPSAGSWTLGGSTALQSGQRFDLLTSPQSLSGDTWSALIVGQHTNGCPAGGSVSQGIP